MLGGIVSGLGSVGAALVNSDKDKQRDQRSYNYTKQLQDSSNEFNAKEAEKSFERQKELLKMQQEYNTPAAQMQRLRAAGLNPNLIYSNALGGDVSASSTPQATNASASQFQVHNNMSGISDALGGLASLVQNFALQSAQVRNLDAQTAKTSGVDTDFVSSQISNTNADTNKKESEIKLSDAQRNKVIQETDNLAYTLKNLLPSEYAAKIAEVDKIANDIKNSQQLTQAQVAQLEAAVKDLHASADLKGKQGKKLDKEIARYDEIIDSQLGLNKETQQGLVLDNQLKTYWQNVFGQLVQDMQDNGHTASERVQRTFEQLKTLFMMYILHQFGPK